MRKALDIMVLLFVLTTLAFSLIGCDGNADLAKPEENQLPAGQSPGVCDCPPVRTA